MRRTVGWAALLLVVGVGLAGCSSSESSTSTTPVASSTSTRGRVAFGCALERGIQHADATTRHYGNRASRELFHAALAAEEGYVVAARLWNASDEVESDNTGQALARLLAMCSTAGFTDTADMPELRSYLCSMNADLARERPTLGSFGRKDTRSKAGDPRRADVKFVGTAQFLLALKVDDQWFDFENPFVAFSRADDGKYQTALRQTARRCAQH